MDAAVQQAVDDAADEMRGLMLRLGEQSEVMLELRTELRGAAGRAETAERELEVLRPVVSTAEAEILRVEAELKAARDLAVGAALAHAQATLVEVQRASTDLAQAEARAEEDAASAAAAAEAVRAELARTRQALSDSQSELVMSELALSHGEETIAELEEEARREARRGSEAAAALSVITAELAQVKQEAELARQEAERAHAEVGRCAAEARAASDAAELSAREAEQVKQEAGEANARLEHARQEAEKASGELVQVRADLEKSKEEATEAKCEAESAKADAAESRLEAEQARGKARQAQVEAERVAGELSAAVAAHHSAIDAACAAERSRLKYRVDEVGDLTVGLMDALAAARARSTAAEEILADGLREAAHAAVSAERATSDTATEREVAFHDERAKSAAVKAALVDALVEADAEREAAEATMIALTLLRSDAVSEVAMAPAIAAEVSATQSVIALPGAASDSIVATAEAGHQHMSARSVPRMSAVSSDSSTPLESVRTTAIAKFVASQEVFSCFRRPNAGISSSAQSSEVSPVCATAVSSDQIEAIRGQGGLDWAGLSASDSSEQTAAVNEPVTAAAMMAATQGSVRIMQPSSTGDVAAEHFSVIARADASVTATVGDGLDTRPIMSAGGWSPTSEGVGGTSAGAAILLPIQPGLVCAACAAPAPHLGGAIDSALSAVSNALPPAIKCLSGQDSVDEPQSSVAVLCTTPEELKDAFMQFGDPFATILPSLVIAAPATHIDAAQPMLLVSDAVPEPRHKRDERTQLSSTHTRPAGWAAPPQPPVSAAATMPDPFADAFSVAGSGSSDSGPNTFDSVGCADALGSGELDQVEFDMNDFGPDAFGVGFLHSDEASPRVDESTDVFAAAFGGGLAAKDTRSGYDVGFVSPGAGSAAPTRLDVPAVLEPAAAAADKPIGLWRGAAGGAAANGQAHTQTGVEADAVARPTRVRAESVDRRRCLTTHKLKTICLCATCSDPGTEALGLAQDEDWAQQRQHEKSAELAALRAKSGGTRRVSSQVAGLDKNMAVATSSSNAALTRKGPPIASGDCWRVVSSSDDGAAPYSYNVGSHETAWTLPGGAQVVE
jgi:hypothetical protein